MVIRARLLLVLGLVASVGCSSAELLYPGDEIEAPPAGYGLVVIGAGPSIQLYTLEFCDRANTCAVIGPFMQTQEAYLMRLPVGEQCLAEIQVRFTGDIEAGGGGMGHSFRSDDDCFEVRAGQPSYIGHFHAAQKGLRVEHRPDIKSLVLKHYPGLSSATIGVQTGVD